MQEITEAILNKLNTLVVVVGSNGQVEYVSPAAKNILGYEPDLLVGEGWWDLTRTTSSERIKMKEFVNSLLKAESNSESISYERLLKTSSGESKWILWNSSKGPNDTVIGIGQDITLRKEAEEELKEKHKELSDKALELTQSINYAKRIQDAILPDISSFTKVFTDAFILYKPKDVVSGDLYWFYEKNDSIFVAAIDCTGHGVPGAMMSVIANSLLRDLIQKRGMESPKEILEQLDAELFVALNKQNNGTITSDGMDIALCKFDKKNNTLTFSGAFRPLLIIRNNEIIEEKGSKYPIGFYQDIKKEFSEFEFNLLPNDTIYLFSDGYADQFGGEKEKKFNKKRFKELLLSSQDMLMEEQEAFFDYAFKNWKQDLPQTDDILLLGIKY